MAKSFPDLNNDGEVTQADVLKGRGVYKKGGKVKKMAGGGVTRADGCVMKGHTKGKIVTMKGGGYC